MCFQSPSGSRKSTDPHSFCSLTPFLEHVVQSLAVKNVLEKHASCKTAEWHSQYLQFNHVFATHNVRLDFEERASKACFRQDGRVTHRFCSLTRFVWRAMWSLTWKNALPKHEWCRKECWPSPFLQFNHVFVTSYVMLDLEESAPRASIMQHRTVMLIVSAV